MFDFSKYNLGELNAIYEMLDYIDHGGCIDYQMQQCSDAIGQHMEEMVRQARQAAEVDRIVQACIAGAPPADPPAPPDMFGWAGDALDDLCAAGEVLGSDE